MMKIARAAFAVFGASVLASSAFAEEGMWTFDNIPTTQMQRDIGWAPDQPWLDRVMAASGRLPNCSASTVSGEGLVLTNYHCIDDECLRNLSTPERDFQAGGFMARTRVEELRCTGLTLLFPQSVSDVTAQIDAATAGASPDAFVQMRDAEISRLESACVSDVADRCDVVTLYQGGRYALYAYKRYDDVRVVFAPEEQAAFFGFPPDNFTFPRFAADFAFLRVYENGAPALTPSHLRMRFTPLEEREVVLAPGYPGRTSRLAPTSQLAFQRDYFLPTRIADLADWRGRLIAYGERGPAEARLVSEALHTAENTYKAYWGRRLALVDTASWARLVAAEQDLQARVQRNRAAQRDIGDAWGEVARAQALLPGGFLRVEYLETRAGNGSNLFRWARQIVRGGAERARPDAERLPEFTQSRIRTVEQSVLGEWAVQAELEQLQLTFWLSKVREELTADDAAVLQILGRESPEGLAQRLVTTTRLGDRAARERLWRGGAAAVAASTDPLIVFVRQWDQLARDARAWEQREVEAPSARARERIARARFRAFGTDAYPDATFTLRLSYGRVAGLTETDGRVIGPFTTLGGLRARATGAAPYALPPRWTAVLPRLDPNTIFNVATTHDIIGGNSGSALVDREGRVVGALFDGNLHSLGGEFFYDGERNRAVSVAATTIRVALADVYGMDALLAELEQE